MLISHKMLEPLILLLLFCGTTLALPKPIELKDSKGNILRRVITQDSSGNYHTWFEFIRTGMQSEIITNVFSSDGAHLGYPGITTFQYNDGLLDVFGSWGASLDEYRFVQFQKANDEWSVVKTVKTHFVSNTDEVELQWMGKGKFKIRKSNPDDNNLPRNQTHTYEVFGIEDRNRPDIAVALVDGKPFPSGILPKKIQNAAPQEGFTPKAPATSEGAAPATNSPATPKVPATRTPDQPPAVSTPPQPSVQPWLLWLFVSLAAVSVGFVLWRRLKC